MRKLFSFVLAGLVLIGGATLGLQSASASAAERQNTTRHKHHHHHKHHHRHYQKNKLSY